MLIHGAGLIIPGEIVMTDTNKQVLVVEDDPGLRRVMVSALRHEGYIVHEEENGQEAERRIRALKPALVLLDVMLPGKTGLDICADLKQDPEFKKIPILMMTCLTGESKHEDDYWKNETGADDFITKPFPVGEMLRRVSRMLG
jgi:DNA-binding response OmpR family regulator